MVLTQGDTFTVDRGGLTLIQAQGKTTVCVLARHVDERHISRGQPSPAGSWRHWIDAIVNAGLARGWAPYG